MCWPLYHIFSYKRQRYYIRFISSFVRHSEDKHQLSTMFAKLFVIAAVAAMAMAMDYPPGIHPALCPNYPFCDMELLSKFTPDGTPIPEWERNPNLLPMDWNRRAPIPYPHIMHGSAARYPADFDASRCPNYPYC